MADLTQVLAGSTFIFDSVTTANGVLFIAVENQGDMPALYANEQAQQYGKYIDIRMTFKET